MTPENYMMQGLYWNQYHPNMNRSHSNFLNIRLILKYCHLNKKMKSNELQ